MHDSPLAEKAKQFIDENYSNPEFNIEALTQKLYTSAPTLRRKFFERFGIPPKQYLIKVRLIQQPHYYPKIFHQYLKRLEKADLMTSVIFHGYSKRDMVNLHLNSTKLKV